VFEVHGGASLCAQEEQRVMSLPVATGRGLGRHLRSRRHWFLLVGAAVLLAYPWVFRAPYQIHVAMLVFMYAGLAQAWNILAGYCGQISLGHSIFFGIGAYTSTLLLLEFELSPWIGMLIGAILAVIASQIIGFPTFRFHGNYFAIATVAISKIVQQLFIALRIGGGAQGTSLPLVEPSLLMFEFGKSKAPYYYIMLGIAVVVQLSVMRLERVPLGYFFRATKQEPQIAESLGVDTKYYKMVAIALSALFTAMFGTVYAQYVHWIDPFTVFPIELSVLIVLVAAAGGAGTLWGPVVGAFVIVPLAEFTRLTFGGGFTTALDFVVYGVLIIAIAAFEPNGLMAVWGRFKRWRGW
jgi:branched-chain amino acid transport system permease protein